MGQRPAHPVTFRDVAKIYGIISFGDFFRDFNNPHFIGYVKDIFYGACNVAMFVL